MPTAPQRTRRHPGSGFTLIELLIAIGILLFAVAPLAKFIGDSINLNSKNRYDSTGLIIAERQMELMMAQTMAVGNPAAGGNYFFNSTLPDGTAVIINMGVNSPPGPSSAGANIITDPAGNIYIDWTQASGTVPANYLNQFTSTEGYTYETRWRVMTIFQIFNGINQPTAKRIIISTRGVRLPKGATQTPTTLITIVGKRQ